MNLSGFDLDKRAQSYVSIYGCHDIVTHTLFTIYFTSLGIHQRPGDLEVNVCKTKALTNMRSATKGITVGITSAIDMSLDSCVEYIAADEILEVTPSLFRMAKNPAMAKKGKGKK